MLLASIVFYLSWSPAFLLHFLLILAINYPFFITIHSKRSMPFLIAIVILNLLNLSFFKYFYFFTKNVAWFFPESIFKELSNLSNSIIPEIILPLAISFYTFQIIALQVDAYRGELEKRPSFFHFMLFIMFFPQLIAGPIMRHNQLLPYLDKKKDASKMDAERGLALIGSGLIKKVLMADFLIEMIGVVSANPSQYHAVFVIISIYFFAFMVYLDFSAYTDLARGSAFLLGFKIPINFRGAFFQISFADHWKRWHLTLTQWLRDYLYFSMGGSRRGVLITYIGIIITFFLGGLWHGAGWGFILWGFLSGLYLALERMIYSSGLIKQPASWGIREGENKNSWYKRSLYNVFKAFFVFNVIAMTGIFFYAGLDLSLAENLIRALMHNWDSSLKAYPITTHHIFVVAGFLILHWLEYNDYEPFSGFQEKIRGYSRYMLPIGSVLVFVLCALYAKGDQPFVYFQF